MATTGKLGTSESLIGDVILAQMGTAPSGSQVFEEALESELGLVSSVDWHGDFSVSIEDAMVLVQDVDVRQPILESLSSIITLTSEVRGNIINVSVASSMNLLQTARSSVFFASLASTLELEQDVAYTPRSESLSSILELEQEATTAPGSELSANVSSLIDLDQDITVQFPVINREVASELELVSQVNVIYEVEVASVITLVDEALRIFKESHEIDLLQTVEFGRSRNMFSNLDLGHTVDVQLELGRSLESEIEFEHYVSYILDRGGDTCLYRPNTTDSDFEITAPTLTHGLLTLTWPYVTPTSTLVLRNPNFDNTERHTPSRVNRATRGGTLQIFSDPVWPLVKTLSVVIDALSEDQADDFLQFIQDSVGQEIGLLDWESRQWRGIITTPDAEVTDNGNCRKSISFEFEGELV